MKWHRFYYLLAAIDLATIIFSLSLTHRILDMHSHSISVNTTWLERAERYEKINEMAALTNAPGNDVFDSHDVATEKKRLQESLALFKSLIKVEFEDILSLSNVSESTLLASNLKNVDLAMDQMVAEANLIFGYFDRKEEKLAGKRMATMDRKYAKLNASLRELRSNFRNIQKKNLTQEQIEAASQVKWEYLIAAIIFLIVVGICIYGSWLARKIDESKKTIERHQASLESSARLVSLGTMSAGIAHEINNPLAVIHGSVSLLECMAKKGPVESATTIEFTTKILQTCNRISLIIKGLRTFSRDSSKDPFDVVPLGELLRDSLSFCKERFKNHGIELRVECAKPEMLLECRQVQIAQVLINLLNNAFDEIHNQPQAWVEVTADINDGLCTINVKDCGSGIPKQIRDKMMTPFFTTKEVGKGTGLGLAISHGIAAEHHGRLYIDETSTNTLFVLEIPAKQSAKLTIQEKVAA